MGRSASSRRRWWRGKSALLLSPYLGLPLLSSLYPWVEKKLEGIFSLFSSPAARFERLTLRCPPRSHVLLYFLPVRLFSLLHSAVGAFTLLALHSHISQLTRQPLWTLLRAVDTHTHTHTRHPAHPTARRGHHRCRATASLTVHETEFLAAGRSSHVEWFIPYMVNPPTHTHTHTLVINAFIFPSSVPNPSLPFLPSPVSFWKLLIFCLALVSWSSRERSLPAASEPASAWPSGILGEDDTRRGCDGWERNFASLHPS